MKNKKILLYVLIPIIIVLLVLIAGVAYLKLNSTPEKIFENTISKVFGMFETSEEQYATMKGTMNLTASVESDSEELEAINKMLEGSSIELNMEADTKNMIINGNVDLMINNQELLNAAILLQDQKGYVYLKDYLDKYLEVPQENMEYSDLTEYYDKLATLDQNVLMQAIKEEIIASILSQELVQEDTTLILDGQETKVTASTLNLQGQAITTFAQNFLKNLKANEKFLTALGGFKTDAMALIDDMLDDGGETSDDMQLIFKIYTKGFFCDFVGIACQATNPYIVGGTSALEDYETYSINEITRGFEILKHNDIKYEFGTYNEYEGEREEAFNVIVEDKKQSKNKGTATITMTVDGEQIVVTYDYEKQGNQLYFSLSTELEGMGLSLSGNVVENGNNVKGVFVLSVQEESFGKIDLKCAYDFSSGVPVQKVDVQNAVLIDELSEEDQNTLMTNFANSKLYELIEQSGLSDSNEQPQVTYEGYTVKYNVPDDFEMSEYSDKEYKMYIDENFNSINVTINGISIDTYMKDLEEEYVMTSEFYENQKISDIRNLTVNGKEYKLRTITYNDEFGTYADLYFAYPLDDEHCYAVEVESEGGNISMDTIKYFLDMTVE